MATSTVPAVKAAIGAMISTAMANEPNVLVCHGDPDWLADDIIAVQGVTLTADARVMGTRAREERYTVYATVSCYRGGTDQMTVTTRAYALLGLIETALRTDPTVAGTARLCEVAGHELNEALSVDDSGAVLGRVAEIVVRLAVQARI